MHGVRLARDDVSAARDASAPHDIRQCDAALARAFEFLGKRWNGMILGTLAAGPTGFAEAPGSAKKGAKSAPAGKSRGEPAGE